jgi:hypothetical protein
MQEHLCRTLAHFVVLLGSKLGLPISADAERFILDAAHTRWQKEERFLWLPAVEDDEDDEDPDFAGQTLPTTKRSALT